MPSLSISFLSTGVGGAIFNFTVISALIPTLSLAVILTFSGEAKAAPSYLSSPVVALPCQLVFSPTPSKEYVMLLPADEVAEYVYSSPGYSASL
jgi:hypothetical protein